MKARLWGIVFLISAGVLVARAESPDYFVYVSNERSGDISVIDGATDAVVATFKAGKRPRGIHAAPDGKRLFVTLSGSPRMAPGLDENRAPADKTADGLGVIDPGEHKLIDRWHVGSDPEQFRQRETQKTYWALVSAPPRPASGEWTDWLLKNDPRIYFLFVGDGPRRAEIERFARENGIGNFQYRGYFGREQLRYSLSMADVHLISLRKEFVGISVPGKLYGIMASGRPALRWCCPQSCGSS